MNGARKKLTVLPDVALVKKMVDALCYCRGGPLPDWDDVYEDHCGETGEVLEERADLECVQLEFGDGHKYWYPVQAMTTPVKKPTPQGLEETVIGKMKGVIAKEMSGYLKNCIGALENKYRMPDSGTEDWLLGFEVVMRELSGAFDQTEQGQQLVDMERKLAAANRTIEKLKEERVATLSKVQDQIPTTDALYDVVKSLREENEDLKVQLAASEELKQVHSTEFAALAKRCRRLEEKLQSTQPPKSVDIVTSSAPSSGKKKLTSSAVPPIQEFKAAEREKPKTKRSSTPPSRTSPGMSSRTRASTPPARTRTFTSARPVSPTSSVHSARGGADASRRVGRQDSITSNRGSKAASANQGSPRPYASILRRPVPARPATSTSFSSASRNASASIGSPPPSKSRLSSTF
eukprot:TRINITY_DN4112_c0_g2_i1.p1 TRINITY_DN4112_c0_g2~~TRINITY_DN4112_c0_g2_i1.p1  ORF type:complete len:406 (+),score=129.71 TRINITY_DN4112_c0_g2_i1:49-1266(+)